MNLQNMIHQAIKKTLEETYSLFSTKSNYQTIPHPLTMTHSYFCLTAQKENTELTLLVKLYLKDRNYAELSIIYEKVNQTTVYNELSFEILYANISPEHIYNLIQETI